MNKLIIAGIMATTVVVGGILAFMPLFDAAAASIVIDRANTSRDGTVLTIKASLADIPLADIKYKVCVVVNGEDLVCDTKPADTP
jgi:hypothetical protein